MAYKCEGQIKEVKKIKSKFLGTFNVQGKIFNFFMISNKRLQHNVSEEYKYIRDNDLQEVIEKYIVSKRIKKNYSKFTCTGTIEFSNTNNKLKCSGSVDKDFIQQFFIKFKNTYELFSEGYGMKSLFKYETVEKLQNAVKKIFFKGIFSLEKCNIDICLNVVSKLKSGGALFPELHDYTNHVSSNRVFRIFNNDNHIQINGKGMKKIKDVRTFDIVKFNFYSPMLKKFLTKSKKNFLIINTSKKFLTKYFLVLRIKHFRQLNIVHTSKYTKHKHY